MIVPGSPFGIDHPFSWYAILKDITTGKQLTLWMNGVQMNRQVVADHVTTHFRNVEVVTIDQCTGPPTRALIPVPRHLVQYGIVQKIRKAQENPNAIRRVPLRSRIIRKSILSH